MVTLIGAKVLCKASSKPLLKRIVDTYKSKDMFHCCWSGGPLGGEGFQSTLS
eukprot:gene32467-42062_t